VLVLGGARSGKSRLAVELAAEQTLPVVFLATGQAGDEEMAERIKRHRAQRPAGWRTIEEPLRLAETISGVDSDSCLVVDCLSLWVSNLIERSSAAVIESEAAVAAEAARARQGLTIAVSNEVGLGLVPMHPLGRSYRDLLGNVNSIWAERADQTFFVIAGRALRLEPRPRLNQLNG
jgi:adenosylcobinamide kinase/adenosylcobinamide-phosphate guanylyltransferase